MWARRAHEGLMVRGMRATQAGCQRSHAPWPCARQRCTIAAALASWNWGWASWRPLFMARWNIVDARVAELGCQRTGASGKGCPRPGAAAAVLPGCGGAHVQAAVITPGMAARLCTSPLPPPILRPLLRFLRKRALGLLHPIRRPGPGQAPRAVTLDLGTVCVRVNRACRHTLRRYIVCTEVSGKGGAGPLSGPARPWRGPWAAGVPQTTRACLSSTSVTAGRWRRLPGSSPEMWEQGRHASADTPSLQRRAQTASYDMIWGSPPHLNTHSRTVARLVPASTGATAPLSLGVLDSAGRTWPGRPACSTLSWSRCAR